MFKLSDEKSDRIMYVKKRDGRIVEFAQEKITNAMKMVAAARLKKARASAGEMDAILTVAGQLGDLQATCQKSVESARFGDAAKAPCLQIRAAPGPRRSPLLPSPRRSA